MSKIQAAFEKATGLKQNRGEERQDYLVRLMQAVAKIDDAAWDKLTDEEQEVHNVNVQAYKDSGKDASALSEFPDYVAADVDDEPAPRRRKAAEADDAAARREPFEPKVGNNVKVVNGKGTEYEGKVVEVDENTLVIAPADGDELEFNRGRLKSLELLDAPDEPKAKGRRKAAEADDEPEQAADPVAVGNTVEVTTKRGKVIKGEITEIEDDRFVVNDGTDVVEVNKDRVESIKLVKAAKGAATKTTTAAAKGKGDDAVDEPAKRTRSTNEGVSVGQRIRELIVDNLDADKTAIGKLLTKEKLDFKENTLTLTFAETHKIIKLLDERKMLKK